MPLYEYTCETCTYTFDKMVMKTDSDVRCPICQGEAKKIMSTFSIGHSSDRLGNRPDNLKPKMCTNC